MQTKSFVNVCAVLLCLISLANSQSVWVKHEGNPVLSNVNGYAAEPAVLYDSVQSFYQMWYSVLDDGIFKIYYATSNNGLDWLNYSENPVLTPGTPDDWDGSHVKSSAVIFVDGVYKLYYIGVDNLSQSRIGLAISTDGIHWEKHPGNPILSLGEPGSWDAAIVYHPKVIFDGNVYFMWYAGSDGDVVQGGLANSEDGFTWAKYPNNPVLLPGSQGNWDEYSVWPSSGVVLRDGKFILQYTGVDYSNRTNSPIGLATSEDGVAWEKHIHNPVLRPGNFGTWDHAGLGNASLILDGEKFRLWYSAHTETNGPWHIGYAESGESIPAGSALKFDGVDDIVRIDDPNNALDLDDFTIEAWVYRSVSGANHMAVSKSVLGENPEVNSNFWLWIKQNDRAEVGWELPNSENFQVEGQTRIEANKWYHIAGVRSASTNALHIYVNGIEDAPPATTFGKPNTQDISLFFGDTPGVPRERFNGIIDEVRIWNIARSGQEIRATMNLLLDGTEDGLVGYWRLDEGEGQAVHDLSPSGNHGHLGDTPETDSNDPMWVQSMIGGDNCTGIALPAADGYGRIGGGDQTHSDKVTYCFPAQTGDKYLSFEAYDIDNNDEVDLRLNGIEVFGLQATTNDAWNRLFGVLLSDALINDLDDNELTFDNTKNPPNSWRWGVRQVSVDPFYALPSPAAYGRIHDGDQTHPDKVVYFFTGQPGDLSLIHEVYDIDHVSEVDVVLNGTKIKNEALTADNSWSETRILLLPDFLVNDTGINVLIFDNTTSPNQNSFWGVRKVSIDHTLHSSIAANLPEGSYQISGDLIRGGQYLFDGSSTPISRPNGDDVLPPDSIEASTIFSADGRLIVEFVSAQHFDYLVLYPEGHHQRYYNYRIEASQDGQSWITLIDKDSAYVHGAQLDDLPSTAAKFLRISGESRIVGIDSLRALELSEDEYWQVYDELLQSTLPSDFAIAELILVQRQPQVSIVNQTGSLPVNYNLAQNFPNPFNPSTIISFETPRPSKVKLVVYNLLGELVATLLDREMPANYHSITFDASGLPSGIYFYRLQVNDFVSMRKMLLTR